MLQSEKIIEVVKKAEPRLIEDRRRFHINAELSCMEFETAKKSYHKMFLKKKWLH